MLKHSRKWLVLSLLGVLLAGCASTKLVSVWQDPKFSGPQLQGILVIGVTRQAGIRRIFEDEFVRQLAGRGVKAVASYTLIPEDGEVPKERLAEAVKEAGVEGILITRLVKVERETRVYPGSFAGPPYMGFYGFYSSAWIGFYDPPQIYAYDVVTSETNLFDSRNQNLLWSGTSETFSPRDVNQDTQVFASVIIQALEQSRLI
jgi:hypothetical protein